MTGEQKRVVILDGYNVIHKIPALEAQFRQSLEASRRALLRMCREWTATRRDVWRFWVVFDGDSDVIGTGTEGGQGVVPLYTRSGETADARIVSLLSSRSGDYRFAVVSEDNFVRRNARALGADVLRVSDFTAAHRRGRSRRARKAGGGDKASLSSGQEREINEELRRVWGVE